ncbi:hypothetical protein AC579_2385 [Pseudocercospora musae]|uniref:Uncharacterized protein n=1 Tax=Pseudocercospora musae TaxID=113226 RepID=A0A139IGU1_9PEZI|nr:hypothetical protein AC579_2385 [Pseudocercospora musae]
MSTNVEKGVRMSTAERRISRTKTRDQRMVYIYKQTSHDNEDGSQEQTSSTRVSRQGQAWDGSFGTAQT